MSTADCVDTTMDHAEASVADPVMDRVRGQPERQKLLARDQTELTCCN
jgi:hypothetical protein